MNEEILMVLKMVEEGKLSADKAKELIDTLLGKTENIEAVKAKSYEDKFLKVEVLSHKGDQVNVKLPVKIVKEILKVSGKLPIASYIEGMNGVDIDSLMNTLVTCLDNEVIGDIVDVCSCEGDIVKIFID